MPLLLRPLFRPSEADVVEDGLAVVVNVLGLTVVDVADLSVLGGTSGSVEVVRTSVTTDVSGAIVVVTSTVER